MSQGFGTRRECRTLVLAGRVSFDGHPVDDPQQILPVPALDAPEPPVCLVVDGRTWPLRQRALVMLHKPAGYECSLKPRHHPSVMSLLPMPLRLRGVQPVGRLDEDTTGLLLLTDDGELNHRLTSPKWHAPKTYRVNCRHPLDDGALDRLRGDLVLEDDPVPVRALQVERSTLDPRIVTLVIGEGRYHQVKRMLAAVSNRVDAMHRTGMGPLHLDEALPVGQWRWLSGPEEAALRALRKATDPTSG